jgi:integrase
MRWICTTGCGSARRMRTRSGTQSVADEVPVDVVQKVLGHASLQTTTLYVRAEKQRVLEEVADYYARRALRDASQKLKRSFSAGCLTTTQRDRHSLHSALTR